MKTNFRKDIEEKTKDILEFYHKDLSVNKISNLMNCDFSVIKRILLKNKIKIKPLNYYRHNKGKNNPMFGKHHSKQTIKKIKNSLRRGFENGRVSWNKGKKIIHSKEIIEKYRKNAKKNLSQYWLGKKNPHLSLRNLKNNPVNKPGVKKKMSEKAKLRIGEKNPFYGKKHSEKTKRKLSEANSGENNSNWLGGKSFEPYDKSFNNKFKRAIRKRDNQICMLCGIHREKLKKALFIHHINYDKKLTIPQNCVSLCPSCHSKTNVNREHWIKFFQSLLAKKYNYQYSKTGEIILGVLNEIHK